jgi:hypothetical protein
VASDAARAEVAIDKPQNADLDGRACSDRRIAEQLDQSPDREEQLREIGKACSVVIQGHLFVYQVIAIS